MLKYKGNPVVIPGNPGQHSGTFRRCFVAADPVVQLPEIINSFKTFGIQEIHPEKCGFIRFFGVKISIYSQDNDSFFTFSGITDMFHQKFPVPGVIRRAAHHNIGTDFIQIIQSFQRVNVLYGGVAQIPEK
jgi:hypothetical protein